MYKILQFRDKLSWDHKSSVSPFSLYGGYEYKGCVANHLLGSEVLKNSFTLLKTFYSFFVFICLVDCILWKIVSKEEKSYKESKVYSNQTFVFKCKTHTINTYFRFKASLIC